MCGIAGQLGPTHSLEFSAGAVTAMIMAMRHRGPDAQDVQTFGPAVLGHARLSIIDLSAAANQPMSDTEGRCAIVFNGEIYNFQEIRDELKAKGARFRTASDTEVILEAYKAWGTDCLRRFNGMFAFALWDKTAQRLFLARDRFGKKPLYYFRTPDGVVVFASELKALRRHPLCPREIAPAAIRQYLALNYTLTSQCILAGVEKLPPAHWIAFEPGADAVPRPYWSYADAFRNKASYRSEDEAAEALEALLADAVKLRMISDVPLGAMLSGGIDSATITALMAKERAARVNTFSIGFTESDFDESVLARQVADFLKTDHRDRTVEGGDLRQFATLAADGDEPFADTSYLPTSELCSFARDTVKVCLSGDGGDEIFGGYETYIADKVHHWFGWMPGPAIGALRRIADSLPISNRKVGFDEKLRRLSRGLAHDFERAHYSWRTIFDDTELDQILLPERKPLIAQHDPFADFRRFFAEADDLHYLDQAMYVDAKTWLVDCILVKVDRASMTHSLEVRAPLLDYRIAEFAASLPIDMKIKGLKKKYLLRKEHARHLPPSLTPAAKRGFNAPVSHWLAGKMGEFGREVTRAPIFAEWFRPGVIDTLWDEQRDGRRDHALKLFGLVSLGLWAGTKIPVYQPGATS